MNLKAPEGACPSINVAGVEYAPHPVTGAVEINDPHHIAIAQREGFTEVPTTTES